MSREDAQFRLRMPVELREFIRESAQRNQRTLNSEVVFALRQYEKAASNHTA